MRETIIKYLIAVGASAILYLEPTLNFFYGNCAVITIDCFSAYN